ncbi:MAG TPA: cell division protein FtsQ/DivIB [Stellaceae bacterium]|nr:cell division protein FtsQ/DivIB [Stellaceae bacterium]
MRARPGRAAPPRNKPPRRRRLAPKLRRALLWALLPVLVAGCYGAVMLSRLPQGQALVAAAGEAALAASARLGLVVGDIEVEGRETTDRATIIAALGAARGAPILGVSPERAKEQLERLPWVRSASIERRLPGTLYVRLVERHPLAVWQHDGKQELIDRGGEVIPVGDLGRFARLPTVVGADAPAHATALLAILAREPQLAARVTAAVRVDDRRWNLRIDNATDVLLPEDDPAAAWARLAALERSDGLLQRDLRTIDMRLPDRLVLRVAEPLPGASAPAKKAHPPHPPGKST